MRQELRLTAESDCEFCDGTGLAKIGRDRICDCVQSIPAKVKPFFTNEQLEQIQVALDGSEVKEDNSQISTNALDVGGRLSTSRHQTVVVNRSTDLFSNRTQRRHGEHY